MRRIVAAIKTDGFISETIVYCNDGSVWKHTPSAWNEWERWTQLYPSLPDTQAAGLDHITQRSQEIAQENRRRAQHEAAMRVPPIAPPDSGDTL